MRLAVCSSRVFFQIDVLLFCMACVGCGGVCRVLHVGGVACAVSREGGGAGTYTRPTNNSLFDNGCTFVGEFKHGDRHGQGMAVRCEWGVNAVVDDSSTRIFFMSTIIVVLSS